MNNLRESITPSPSRRRVPKVLWSTYPESGSRRTVLGGATESTTSHMVFWDEEGGHGVAFSVQKNCKRFRMSKRVRYMDLLLGYIRI